MKNEGEQRVEGDNSKDLEQRQEKLRERRRRRRKKKKESTNDLRMTRKGINCGKRQG